MKEALLFIRGQRFDPIEKRDRWGNASGFLIDREGLAVTCNHILEQDNFEVFTSLEATPCQREIIVNDPFNDLAVIQVIPPRMVPHQYADFYPTKLPCLELGNGTKQGQEVVAMTRTGLAFYRTGKGIVQDVDYSLTVEDWNEKKVHKHLLKIEMAITNGFSGGPVLSQNNQVIGMIIAVDKIFAYAVPIKRMKELLEETNGRP